MPSIQYSCDGPNGFHGTLANSPQERGDSYAFQLPIYLSKVVDKVCAAAPNTIFELDVTEAGRSMGLGFLSSGKYIILNNGAYFHNFDIVPPWQTPLANGNVQIFTNPGPARGWFRGPVLTYDKWIPSTLLLTFLSNPDGSRNSQLINVASLILGQNGIWGNILDNTAADADFIGGILGRYKEVRDDVPTIGSPLFDGTPEIARKSMRRFPRLLVGGRWFCLATGGHTRYITTHHVDHFFLVYFGGLRCISMPAGRAVIDVDFEGSGAAIVFFGVLQQR